MDKVLKPKHKEPTKHNQKKVFCLKQKPAWTLVKKIIEYYSSSLFFNSNKTFSSFCVSTIIYTCDKL